MKRSALALLFVAACTVPLPPPRPDLHDEAGLGRPVEASARLPDGPVQVRIASQDRQGEVKITGTLEGPLTFERRGDEVRGSNGTTANHFVLTAPAGGEGLGVAGRLYSGELVVSPHPAGGLRIENRVELETYVHGVVPAELVLWSAEPAEIAAQAIAARTYALCKLRSGAAFLWDDTRDQVYPGRPQLADSPAGRRVAHRLESALEATRGMVLCDSTGALYDIRFHAACGGHTASPALVFPLESRTETASVPCAPCADLGGEERERGEDDRRPRRVHWSWTASENELSRLAENLDLGRRVLSVRVVERDGQGRWLKVEVAGDRRRRTVGLPRLRDALGARKLRSGRILRTWPTDGVPTTGGLYFEGLGWGHGVGLCQNGSHGYASRGWSAEDILHHYCPDAEIVRLGSLTEGSRR